MDLKGLFDIFHGGGASWNDPGGESHEWFHIRPTGAYPSWSILWWV